MNDRHLKPLMQIEFLTPSDDTNGLSTFDVDNAHCYDPGDEARLRGIIEAGGASTKAGTLLHEIGVVKMDLALKTRELDELGHKTTKEQQKASVAKDEASKLRKDLRKTEGDIAKVRSKCDGLQQTHLQLQSRLMTVATAARQNKPWDSAWDAWLPAGSGGSFSRLDG